MVWRNNTKRMEWEKHVTIGTYTPLVCSIKLRVWKYRNVQNGLAVNEQLWVRWLAPRWKEGIACGCYEGLLGCWEHCYYLSAEWLLFHLQRRLFSWLALLPHTLFYVLHSFVGHWWRRVSLYGPLLIARIIGTVRLLKTTLPTHKQLL